MYALIIHFYCYIFYPYDSMDLYCKINVNLNDEETRLLFSDFFSTPIGLLFSDSSSFELVSESIRKQMRSRIVLFSCRRLQPTVVHL